MPVNQITPIPNNEPDAIPALWNSRYVEIDSNFTDLDGRTLAVENETTAARGAFPTMGARLTDISTSLGTLTGDVGGLQLTTTPMISRALRLNWLYSKNRIALELWGGEYSLLDITEIAVQSAILGDDSIDMADTSTLIIGQEYVIFDAVNREAIKITEKLTANRVRISANLTHSYNATAKIARSSFTISAGNANTVIGDTYFSKPFNIGIDNIQRALVLRKQDNASLVRVFFKDIAHVNWTEIPWSWKRSGDPIPDGFIDVEYLFNGNGAISLKVVVEGAATEINHIIATPEETQLQGIHNGPLTPANSSPAIDAIDLPETPTLALLSYSSPVNSALSAVQFQLSLLADFSAVFSDSGELPAGLSYQIPAGKLVVGTNYWYRGRVKDSNGEWSAYSVPTKFTTAASFVFVVAPSNTSPTQGQTNITETPTLTSSAFVVSGGTDTHASSQWQIRSSAGNYAVPAWDSGTDTVNKLTRVVPAGILSAGTTTYYFRVRHNGTAQGWSEWSAETNFVTRANFGVVIGIAQLTTGGGSGTWQRIDENGAAKTTDAAYFNAHPTYAGVVPQTVDAQAMIKVPAFYYKSETIASGTYIGKKGIWISDQPQPGFVLHPAFMNAGSAIAQYWVGKYQGTNDGGTKMGSVAGVLPLVSIDFPTFQARASARNTGGVTGFALWDIYKVGAIQMLALIEMGGSDSQSLIGQGNVSSAAALNTDNATVAQATWRGIVGLWGNVYQAVDGLKAVASVYNIFDRQGNKTYIPTGKSLPASGWPTTMATDSGANFDLRDVFAPATIDATQTNGSYGDYFYTGADTVTYLGGHWGYGAYAGLFYLYCDFSASYSGTFIGARLAKV